MNIQKCKILKEQIWSIQHQRTFYPGEVGEFDIEIIHPRLFADGLMEVVTEVEEGITVVPLPPSPPPDLSSPNLSPSSEGEAEENVPVQAEATIDETEEV